MQKTLASVASKVASMLVPFAIGVVFVYLAGKIAYTKEFPLAYDESYHLGLTNFYTQHLNPFISSQPTSADAYGSIVGDASHLYHYLLSFPLQLVRAFTESQMLQIWALRSISIGLGLLTLYLTFRLARRFGLPKKVAYLATLALAITPVFYNVAAHINYDNLLFPLTLFILLQTWTAAEKLKTGTVPTMRLVGIGSLLLAASLVKYSFLPIFAAVGLYLLVVLLRNVPLRALPRRVVRGAASTTKLQAVLLFSGFVLASGVWLQTYGTNVVRYGTPHPQCHVVLSVERCQAYAPWARNYALHQTRAERPMEGAQLVPFTYLWVKSMTHQTFSLVHVEQGAIAVYTLQKLGWPAVALVLAGLLCMLLLLRSVLRGKVPWVLFGSVGVVYMLSLWGQNFSDYQNLHQVVAVQGRYVLPVLPLLYMAAALGYTAAFSNAKAFALQNKPADVWGYASVAWLGVRRLCATYLLVVVKLSGAARPTGVRFITNP
jgi:hypothetical protein